LPSSAFDRTRAGATAAAIAAAALVLAAAVGIVSVVSRGGFFKTPDWQILVTLVVGFLCGACATAAIRLLERRLYDPLGWIAAVVAPVSFAIVAVGIWWLHGWLRHADLLGKLVATAIVALISTLFVATLRLVARPSARGAFTLVVAAVVCTIGVDALAVAKIWSLAPEHGDTGSATGSAGGRLMLVLGILGVLAYLLTPLVERLEPLLPRPRRVEEPSGL
jgi:peptidoglycan biosynthesis protein MviN/MurJ (putative lipid II flippase)